MISGSTILIAISGFIDLLLVLLIAFSAGMLFLRSIKSYMVVRAFYTRIFFCLLTGFTASVFTYALIRTGGKTVFTGVFLILVFLFYEFKQKKTVIEFSGVDGSEEFSIRKLVYALFSALAIYGWFAMVILKQGNVSFSIPDKDNVFYSQLSLIMNISGRENSFGIATILDEAYSGVSPYHYLDLWLNSAFMDLFGMNPAPSMFLLTYPFLNLISFFGLLAFAEQITKVKGVHVVVTILLLFTGSLTFLSVFSDATYVLNSIESGMEHFGEKFSVLLPFIIASFLLFHKKRNAEAICLLLMLPLLNISLVFAACGGVLVFVVIHLFGRTKREYFRAGIFTVILFVFLILFYTYFGNLEMNFITRNSVIDYTDLNPKSGSLKLFFMDLFLGLWRMPFKMMLLYIPFLIPLIYLFFNEKIKNEFRLISILTICMYSTSLFAFRIFYKMQDAWQFHTNALVILHVLFALSVLLFLFQKNEINKKHFFYKIYGSLLLLFLLVRIGFVYGSYKEINRNNDLYDEKYLTDIHAFFVKQNSFLKGVSLNASGDYSTSVKKRMFNNALYLANMPKALPTVDLSIFDIRIWNSDSAKAEIEKQSIVTLPFYQFVYREKSQNRFETIEESQIRFLTENKIDFLVVNAGANISERMLMMGNVLFTDTRSGQRFIVLHMHQQ